MSSGASSGFGLLGVQVCEGRIAARTCDRGREHREDSIQPMILWYSSVVKDNFFFDWMPERHPTPPTDAVLHYVRVYTEPFLTQSWSCAA